MPSILYLTVAVAPEVWPVSDKTAFDVVSSASLIEPLISPNVLPPVTEPGFTDITGPAKYFVNGSVDVEFSGKRVSPLSIPNSGAKPPFTTDTNAWAPAPEVLPALNVKLSPISKSKPPSSIIVSVIAPPPKLPTWNNAPCPPPVNLIVALLSYKAPSLEIIFEPGIPVIVDLMNTSLISDSVPCTTSPIWNVPTIVSLSTINSVTWFAPNVNLKTFSTIAVALDVSPVIVLPIRLVVEPTTSIPRIIFLDPHWPSDTLKICSLGYNVSEFSPNNKLKKILCPSAVPFSWYSDLIFLISFLLSTPVAKLSGIVCKNSFLNWDKNLSITLSGSLYCTNSERFWIGFGV